MPEREERRRATPEAVLAPEAGFVEVTLGHARDPVAHRLFYSFFPAESHPEEAPVLVLFNGGPGVATTSILWAFGTGPYGLDPAALSPSDVRPIENAFPYTRFSNLLYIDARSTGFSYDLPKAAPLAQVPAANGCDGLDARFYPAAECAGTDALNFVEVLLEFLDSHPTLANNDVVLVGESYGGNRALMMLNLLHYHAAGNSDAGVPDYGCMLPAFRDRVQAHFDRAFPDDAGKAWAPEAVARQFGWQVLIQPGLRTEYNEWSLARDPDIGPHVRKPEPDPYDVRRSGPSGDWIGSMPGIAISEPDSLALLLGLDPAAIPRLTPSSGRGEAFRVHSQGGPRVPVPLQTSLHARLGALAANDEYWLPFVDTMSCGTWMDLPALYEMAGRTHTFITNARYDTVVWTDSILAKMELERGAEHDASLPEGAARPGIIRFASDDGTEVEVRFPEYEAGHEVTMSTPRELGEDVEAWLRTTGALRAHPRR